MKFKFFPITTGYLVSSACTEVNLVRPQLNDRVVVVVVGLRAITNYKLKFQEDVVALLPLFAVSMSTIDSHFEVKVARIVLFTFVAIQVTDTCFSLNKLPLATTLFATIKGRVVISVNTYFQQVC